MSPIVSQMNPCILGGMPVAGQSILTQLASRVPRHIPVDITESKEQYTITADVPGCEKGDVNLELDDDNILTISVNKSFATEEESDLPRASTKAADKAADDAAAASTDAADKTAEEAADQTTEEAVDKAADKVDTRTTVDNSEVPSDAEKLTGADVARPVYPVFHRIERRTEFQSRSLKMPANIVHDSMTANLNHGVLVITVDKEVPLKKKRSITIV